MKKNWLIFSILWISSQIWLIFVKIQNSDIWYNFMNWRSHWLSDGIFWFFYIWIFLYLSFALFLYSIWKDNFHWKVWLFIYSWLRLDKLELWKYFRWFLLIFVLFILPFVYLIFKINEFDNVLLSQQVIFIQFISLVLILIIFYLYFKILKSVWNYSLKMKWIGFMIYLIIITFILILLLLFFYHTNWIDNYSKFYEWLINWNYKIIFNI
jgi:hypothetical protein